MGTWTVQTTTAEDDAITYAYDTSQRPAIAPGSAPPAETIQVFFDRMTHVSTVAPMVTRHQGAKNAELIGTLDTIPEANRPAARTEIESTIVKHGGTVKLRECRYLWSTNTAAPPRNNSIEADVNQANLATLTKLTFHYLDADNVNRMAGMMSDTPVGTLVRIEDTANPANFLEVTTTAVPIQRQGANGYVEMVVKFGRSGGALADTLPMKTTFS